MSLPEALNPTTLREMITFLAAADDEDAVVSVMLTLIGRQARRELALCDVVSLTYAGDGGVTTLEADPELVRAVDEAQYPDGDGPCRRVVRDGQSVVQELDVSMKWPGFPGQAPGLGFRSAVAVPLFTAVGEPVAVLDLWSRSPIALEPLGAALVALFDSYGASTDWVAPAGLDPGERQLIAGLGNALELRGVIDWAVAYLADLHQVDPDEAFELLRGGARSDGTDIARAGRRLLAISRGGERMTSREPGQKYYSPTEQAVAPIRQDPGDDMPTITPTEASLKDTASTATPSTRIAPAVTVEGLLVTAVPAMLTTIVLDSVGGLQTGLQKMGVATVMSVVLWWVVQGRKRHGRHIKTALARHWRWGLLALASVAVLAIVVTKVVFGRPTPITATISSISLALLVAQAYFGRHLEPVAAATVSAISGAAIGLCITVAL